MANYCYNWANLEGSKEMLDLFEKRLAEATKEVKHLWWETYFAVLDKPIEEGVSYEVFGSRYFCVDWERESETSGMGILHGAPSLSSSVSYLMYTN